ncbi:MAG: lipopolysaccharide assembly protein LapA domain-containing protein [Armatimonadota bacterium]
MAKHEAGPVLEPTGGEDRREGRPRAAGATKPGALARAAQRCRASLERIRLPALDWRTFAWGLLVLIVLAFIIRNWAPVRISFFGWYFDAPRAIVFVIIFLLGMLTAWLLEVRSRRAATGEAEEARAEEEAIVAGDEGYEAELAERGLTGEEEAALADLDLEDDEVAI